MQLYLRITLKEKTCLEEWTEGDEMSMDVYPTFCRNPLAACSININGGLFVSIQV